MSESCKCDNCPAVGRRRRGAYAPDGWLFLEAQDEDTKEISVVYACSDTCALAQWRKGPGKLALTDASSAYRRDTSAAPAFPEGSGRDPFLLPTLARAQTEAELDHVFDAIFDLVCLTQNTGDVAACDLLLRWVGDPGRVHLLHLDVLLTTIRLTSSLRTKLPAWGPARDVIRGELQRRNEDVETLMCGLEDDPRETLDVG